MPLSDHEKRLLAEMEAALTQEDPRLVSTLNGSSRTAQSGRALAGLAGLLGGMVVLIAGLVVKTPLLGVVGFLIALGGLVLVITNLRAFGPNGRAGAGKASSVKKNWSKRLEDRWEGRNFDS
jgi:Protein of unknown function (DUF3040)